MQFSMDNKPVNHLTFFVSMSVRLLFFVSGLLLVAAALPQVSVGQMFVLGLAALVFVGASSVVLTFSDG